MARITVRKGDQHLDHNDYALPPLPADYSPIFIGGLHRSGTTLMRRLLASHSHIACGPESNLFRDNKLARIHAYLRTEWLAGLDARYEVNPQVVDQTLARLIHAVVMPYCQKRGKQRWAEKTPKNILFIDTLFMLFPKAQFIHMIRDPRDVFCSVREKAAKTTPHWATTTPQQLAESWCRRINCGLPWRERPERYYEVRYEELVHQPEATMQAVLAFLGEPWDVRMLDNHTIFTTSVGRWHKELSAAEVAGIEEVAGDMMHKLGYLLAPASSKIPTLNM
jgi:hypothetical protein